MARLTAFLTALAVAGCGDNVESPLEGDSGVIAGADAANVEGDAGGGGVIDAAIADAAIADAADAAIADAAIADAGVFEEPVYAFLSETGLYDDIATKTLAADVVEFAPEFRLWSDGADKRRWIRLPPGRVIDTTDMDHWRFPIGTRLWKQFSHQVGGQTVLLETRLTEIWGPEDGDVYQATFVWNASDTDAAFSRFGATNIKGTNHDAPAQSLCVRCHRGEIDRVLGFSAVLLSHTDANSIDDFGAAGWFTAMPAPGGYPVPGNATERGAIGYLHVNCGPCHRDSNAQVRAAACYSLPTLQLWVRTTDDSVTDTHAYNLAVDRDLVYWVSPAEGNVGGFQKRIVRGDPTSSAIHYRMRVREAGQPPPFDDDQQMPPAFTDVVDSVGVAAVEAWILSL